MSIKVVFPYTVKFGGKFLPPFKPFEASELDARKLISKGAKVVETLSKEAKVAAKPQVKVKTVPEKKGK